MTFAPVLAAAVLASPGEITSDLAEVVFAQLITQSSPDLVLCLRNNGADPTPSLMKKLWRRDRVVVPGSYCREWTDMDHPDQEIKTGRPAHFLTILNMVWNSSSDVSMQAQDHFNGKNARFWTAHLIRNSAGWQLIAFHLDAEAQHEFERARRK
jgi:hypothetical protein